MDDIREIPVEVYGASRVIEPDRALLQGAWRIDGSGPLKDYEMEVAVDTLCLDSTSFRQLVEAHDADPLRVAEAIEGIVAERGKMHNPVTGSGGILTGTVVAVGSAYRDAPKVGSRVVPLSSLTLTPLDLTSVGPVDINSPHVPVKGRAYLSWLVPWTAYPEDLPFDAALAALDVGNAPMQTRELIDESTETVLVLGGGHAGLLAMAAARDALKGRGRVVLMDAVPAICERASHLGVCDVAISADLRDALGSVAAARVHDVPRADLTVVVVNATDCEAAAIALTADSGTVLFFSMATTFAKAALGSEAVASAARMMIGSGFASDRGSYALELLRGNQELASVLAGGQR